MHVNPVGKTNGSLVLIGNAHPGFNQVIDKERINGKAAVAKIIWVLGLTVSSLGLEPREGT